MTKQATTLSVRTIGATRPRLAAVLLGVAACVVGGVMPALALDTVTISVVNGLSLSPVFLAVDKGYFRDEGIEAKIVSTPMATDAISMTANGQTDIGATAAGVSLYNAGFRGLDLKITASMAIHPEPTTVIPLLIRKDISESGTFHTGKDLKGMAISTNSPGGSIEYKLSVILAKYGMTINDVREVGIGMPETVIALQNKAIDAAILGEPYATEAVRKGIAVMDVEDSKAAIGDIGSVVVYNKNFIAQRRDVGVRAMRALIRAAKDLQANNWKTKENIEIFTRRFKTPLETIDIVAFPKFEPNLTIAKYTPSLMRQAAVHAKNKRMTAAAAEGVASMVDESFVTEATRP